MNNKSISIIMAGVLATVAFTFAYLFYTQQNADFIVLILLGFGIVLAMTSVGMGFNSKKD